MRETEQSTCRPWPDLLAQACNPGYLGRLKQEEQNLVYRVDLNNLVRQTLYEKVVRGRGHSLLVEHLASMCEAPGLIPTTAKWVNESSSGKLFKQVALSLVHMIGGNNKSLFRRDFKKLLQQKVEIHERYSEMAKYYSNPIRASFLTPKRESFGA